MNQGSLEAPSSYVTVRFFGSGGSVLQTTEIPTPTGPIGVGALAGPFRVTISDPGACFIPGCSFEVTVDSRSTVDESREDNNVQTDAVLG